jgi:hypothetical protein
MARTVAITLAPATLSALQASGFRLYAFLQVTTSNKSAVPLVWGRIDAYMAQIALTFDTAASLSAYASLDAIAVNQPIVAGNALPIAPGQAVQVGSQGALQPASGAPAGTVLFTSAATQAYVCGLQAACGSAAAAPFVAFMAYAGLEVALQPSDAVLLMWATSIYDPGVYMHAALGPGLLVAFDGVAQRAIGFDINMGWDAAGASWASPVTAGADLQTALILGPGPNRPLKSTASA